MNRIKYIHSRCYTVFYIIIISSFLLSACSSNNTVNSKNISKPDEEIYNSIQLIDKDLDKGTINKDKAYLLKAYAIFDSKKLPEEYRSDIPVKGGTMLIREIRQVFDELGAETRAKIRPYLFKKGRKR